MSKKNLLSLLTMIMVALASVSFVSCGSDDDDEIGGGGSSSKHALIGSWVCYESYATFTYTFKSDGTGSWSRKEGSKTWTSRFTYTITDSYTAGGVTTGRVNEVITSTNAQDWGERVGGTSSFEFAVSGNSAVIYGQDFTRQ